MAGLEPELLLDPGIRLWVVLPVVLVTFLVGVSRHYLGLLLQAERRPGLQQLGHSQVLIRSRALREHGKYIPRQSFVMRKHFFNDAESGFFRKTKCKISPKNPMTDRSLLTEMMKGNVTNVLSMLIIGGWINSTFSGFVITKVPFPLTLRFKPMLQRGMALPSLDPSWVSSASWYFLNVFGLRSLYPLILGRDRAANQMKTVQDQMTGMAMSLPPDTSKSFKAEWEALELVEHRWALETVEEELVATDLNLEAS